MEKNGRQVTDCGLVWTGNDQHSHVTRGEWQRIRTGRRSIGQHLLRDGRAFGAGGRAGYGEVGGGNF